MNSPDFQITQAKPEHVKEMVHLSHQKRKMYAKAQPTFWKEAEDSNDVQENWLLELLDWDNILSLVSISLETEKIIGFIIGSIIEAPPVYDPGGKTLMVDDFCVADSELWGSVGCDLLNSLHEQATRKGSVQTVVVCGEHDEPKRNFLEQSGLVTASRWYVNEARR